MPVWERDHDIHTKLHGSDGLIEFFSSFEKISPDLGHLMHSHCFLSLILDTTRVIERIDKRIAWAKGLCESTNGSERGMYRINQRAEWIGSVSRL
jgi:hypothetical protein